MQKVNRVRRWGTLEQQWDGQHRRTGLGGFLVDSLGWEYIFLINVPIGVLLLPFAMKYLLSASTGICMPRRIYRIGPVLMVTFMVSLMFLLSILAVDHAVTLGVSTFAILFLTALVLFLS